MKEETRSLTETGYSDDKVALGSLLGATLYIETVELTESRNYGPGCELGVYVGDPTTGEPIVAPRTRIVSFGVQVCRVARHLHPLLNDLGVLYPPVKCVVAKEGSTIILKD